MNKHPTHIFYIPFPCSSYTLFSHAQICPRAPICNPLPPYSAIPLEAPPFCPRALSAPRCRNLPLPRAAHRAVVYDGRAMFYGRELVYGRYGRAVMVIDGLGRVFIRLMATEGEAASLGLWVASKKSLEISAAKALCFAS